MVRPASAAATGLFGSTGTAQPIVQIVSAETDLAVSTGAAQPIGTFASLTSRPAQRAYRCRLCGEIKKGHTCKVANVPSAPEITDVDGVDFQAHAAAVGTAAVGEIAGTLPLGEALPPPRYKCGYCGQIKRGHVCPFAQMRKSAPAQKGWNMQMPPRPASASSDGGGGGGGGGGGDGDGPMVAFVLSLPPATQETAVAEAQRALTRFAQDSKVFEAYATAAESDDDSEDDESDDDGEQDEKQPTLLVAAVADDGDVEVQDVEEVEAENVELLPVRPAVSAAQPLQWMPSPRGMQWMPKDEHADKRARCGQCGGIFVLTKDGTMRKHKCVPRRADGSIQAGPQRIFDMIAGSSSDTPASMAQVGCKRPTASRDPLAAVGDAAGSGKRSHFSERQMTRLVEEFEQNELPTRERKEALAEELGLPPRTIQVWFQNRRSRFSNGGWATEATPAHMLDSSTDWRGIDERAAEILRSGAAAREAAAAVMQLAAVSATPAASAAAEVVGNETETPSSMPSSRWVMPAGRFVLEPANAPAQPDERSSGSGVEPATASVAAAM